MSLLRSKVKTSWKAVCIDGSAFDSTQYKEIMKAVDHKFWSLPKIKQAISKVLVKSDFVDPAEAASKLIKSAIRTDHLMFVNIPGINGPKFTPGIMKEFNRSIKIKKTKNEIEYDWV